MCLLIAILNIPVGEMGMLWVTWRSFRYRKAGQLKRSIILAQTRVWESSIGFACLFWRVIEVSDPVLLTCSS
jgi:hypothetical protein